MTIKLIKLRNNINCKTFFKINKYQRKIMIKYYFKRTTFQILKMNLKEKRLLMPITIIEI